jgi:hypothetical protein
VSVAILSGLLAVAMGPGLLRGALADRDCNHLESQDVYEVLGVAMRRDDSWPPLWGGGAETNHNCLFVQEREDRPGLQYELDEYETIGLAREAAELERREFGRGGNVDLEGLGDLVFWAPARSTLVVFSGTSRVSVRALNGTQASVPQLQELARRFLESYEK